MKTFTLKIVLFFGLLFSAKSAIPQNILTDGNFNSTNVITPYVTAVPPVNIWCSWLNTGAVVNTSVVGGVCKYEIVNAGIQSWEVQLIQWGFPLIPGNQYRLTFDVRADANRNFGVFIGENEGQWTNLNASNYLQKATPNWQTKTIDFITTAVFPLHKLSFEMGAENINMYFDNINLENLGAGPFPGIGIIGSSVPPYNWSSDENMFTADGVTYTLNDFYLIGGELRFRQDDNWLVNWGGTGFPAGVGNLYAPNIQVAAGNYNITFNRLTGAYNFESYQPSIGILGSALTGWVDDIDLQTTDGITYTLLNYPLLNGEAKFRQNNDWGVNWGNSAFPTGFGIPGGPNIPIAGGNYDITFNRHTGWYSFSLICPDPVIKCNADTVVNATAGSCGAAVFYRPPFVINNCGNTNIYQIEGLPGGAFFPVGTTTNTFIAINSTGKTAYCSFAVTVKDIEPPFITKIIANPSSLWPPNHKMKNVIIDYNVRDNCGKVSGSLTVSSNEPINGTGDGDTGPDWVIQDDHHLQLRSERSGSGNGRIYTITITAKDASGNISTKTTDVVVPHNMNITDLTGLNNPGTESTAKAGYIDVNGNYTVQPFDFKVFPNPGSQYFNLQIISSSEEKIEVNIFDINGRLISKLNAIHNQMLRIGNNLRPGLYMIEIIQGKQRKTAKVLKE